MAAHFADIDAHDPKPTMAVLRQFVPPCSHALRSPLLVEAAPV